MPPKKYAVKGEPDFHNISDVQVKAYVDCVQHMIFAYKGYDDEKVKVLESVWKDLTVEVAERMPFSAEEEGTSASLLRKVPKIRKSPAKRKI